MVDKEKPPKTGIFSILKSYIKRNRLGELLVMRGLISPEDLRFALNVQKQSSRPLGEVFIENDLITQAQLNRILLRQSFLRCAAATLFFLASVLAVPKKSRADLVKDIPAQITLVKKAVYSDMVSYPALFGTDEKRSSNIKPFTKWTGMFEKFEQDLNNAKSQTLVRDWQNRLSAYKGLSMRIMAEKVNDLVNESRYTVDQKNWGQSDYWATPVEFLQRGGDCEDFAIAKYTALRTLGIPESRLRVAIVHDNEKNIPHAILIVYTDEGPFILDNQADTLVSAETEGRYRAIFSINQDGWWLHTPPTRTIVASVE